MKKLYIAIALLFSGILTYAQDYDPMVDTLINKIEIDSLVNYVRILSGEDSTYIDGTKTVIENRIQSSNDLAAAYILQTLNSYNLEGFYHDYSTGRNILAIQEGSLYPDQYVMICAHYDAVTAYCADDNASGTAGVLEAARIFSQYDFQYSIIYALWDQEEIGLVGSNAYAEEAAANGDDIMSVINMDMIAYDSNNDDLCEIHAKNYAQTLTLANFVKGMNTVYEIGLAPEIEFPGTSASDHASFWGSSYSAILLIEAYYGGDFNPYYHSVQDRINICNLPYFQKMAKLALGSLAALAMPDINISVEEYFSNSTDLGLYNYPNPFNQETTIWYNLNEASQVNINVINNVGQTVANLQNNFVQKGIHKITFERGDLVKGIYFVVVSTDAETTTTKMVIE